MKKEQVKDTKKEIVRKKRTPKVPNARFGPTKPTLIKTRLKKEAVSKIQTNKKEAEVVTLPGQMPLRAVEKTLILRTDFDEFIHSAAAKVSYAGAICFSTVGTAYTLSNLSLGGYLSGQKASVLDSNGFIPLEFIINSTSHDLIIGLSISAFGLVLFLLRLALHEQAETLEQAP